MEPKRDKQGLPEDVKVRKMALEELNSFSVPAPERISPVGPASAGGGLQPELRRGDLGFARDLFFMLPVLALNFLILR
jgi:hypothetical protein